MNILIQKVETLYIYNKMKSCSNINCISKGEILSLDFFNKNKSSKDGYSSRCKNCVKQSVKASYLKNKEYYIKDNVERQKKWKNENPLEYKELRDKWNEDYKNKEYWKEYYQNNVEKFKEYSKKEEVVNKRNERWKNRYKTDVNFKLKEIMRANFHSFFKDKGKTKNHSFNEIVNYSYDDLKIHLENNFRKGMNWDNFGEMWEIHHIKPQNLYNPSNEQDIKECWDINNLFPLWKTTEIAILMGDNILGNRNIKKNKIYNPNKNQI